MSGGGVGAHDDPRDADAAFIAAARAGWPAALRRLIAAEAEVARLKLLEAASKDLAEACRTCGYDCDQVAVMAGVKAVADATRRAPA